MKSTHEQSNIQLFDGNLTYNWYFIYFHPSEIPLQVCGPDEVQYAIDILPKMLQVTGDAYDRTQRHYTENDLHGLP
jgi:hypothetical protein